MDFIRVLLLFGLITIPALGWSDSVQTRGAGTWVPEGPAPISGGQADGTTNGVVVGAVNAVATHPTDADTIYVGAANGGIWKTTNATAMVPMWVHQTDSQTSLSIGDIRFDPTDSNSRTLVAGVGRFSSYNLAGGSRSGVLRTTDGGSNWNLLPAMQGRNVKGVAARGSTLVAAVDADDQNFCTEVGIFRSEDTGASWDRVTLAEGLPAGQVDALAEDPNNPNTLYASVVFAAICSPGESNGIYKSLDFGETWFKSSPNLPFPLDGLLEDSSATHVEMDVGQANNLYVAIAPASTGRLGGVFYTPDGGAFWFQMDLPGTFEPGFIGIHPGGQGNIHMSLAVDPTVPSLVYIGGDRQPSSNNDTGTFPTTPNSIGATNFTGRLFRGDASQLSGFQWTPLTHVGTFGGSAPHADSRDMAFNPLNDLVQVDDGGIYVHTSPQTTTGDWFSLNGTLAVTEIHSVGYDSNANAILGGNQDTGSASQSASGSQEWLTVNQGDGGDVAIDDQSQAGQSTRFSSAQNFGGFRREVYDSANNLLSRVFPSLTVTAGDPPTGQFVTLIALNQVAPDRLLVGAENGIYETPDQGDTIAAVAPGIRANSGGSNSGQTIAYGALGNADIAYVGGCIGLCGDAGDGLDGLFVRTQAGQAFNHVFPSSGDAFVTGVALNPGNAAEAFLIQPFSVHRSTNTGSNVQDISGNLGGFSAGQFRSLVYLPHPVDPALVIGSDRGIFIAFESSGFASWTPLGSGLPNVPVFDLDYDVDDNRLIAATLGRGAFSLSNVLADSVDAIFSNGFEAQ